MFSSTEREETREVATRCAVSSPAHTSSQALTATRIAGLLSNCFATHRIWQTRPSVTSVCCKPEKNHEKIKRWKFTDDNDIFCTANGWLEDQDQEFFYNGIQALENR